MDKKGQGLSLNVIIIAVLAILVLVIVAAFFLGGFGVLGDKIKGVFSGTVAGTDKDLALSSCLNACERAKGLTGDVVRKSGYCTNKYNIDDNNDGRIDENERDKKCYDPTSTVYVSCSTVSCS